MDLKTNKIVDTQLVQKNEVKNSYAMELDGLKRGLAKLQEEQIAISHLITDRYSQIKKYMRETHPNIAHWFDCWHIAKGIYKKLEAIGKKKKCEVVGQWARSITYWCAMSSGGNGELVVQKWCSILNHACNVHEGHGPLFPKCEHGDVENSVWIKQGTKAYQELEKVVNGRLLMVDIKKISPVEQTSGVEAFHNVFCHFAPKLLHFFHAQMDARSKYQPCISMKIQIDSRQPIRTVNQFTQYRQPKNRRGDGIAKEVKVKQTFDYIDELFEDLLLSREVNGSVVHVRQVIDVDEQARPLPLTRTGLCLNKQDIIDAHRSRFNK
ncbi:hypothetical protein ACJMK2_026759 [Sinanodonta woodiana]|uniref:Transposase n=1 Tax=Sinanodonta woodiana TaxID=1069815 RepID=A0ABD3XKN8_SINWO